MAPPSARPRDKGGTDSSAKDYQNSNFTSARFLGGLQKPWMTTWGNPAQTYTLPMPNHGQTRQQTSPRSLEERPRNQQYHGAIIGHSHATCPGSHQSANDHWENWVKHTLWVAPLWQRPELLTSYGVLLLVMPPVASSWLFYPFRCSLYFNHSRRIP